MIQGEVDYPLEEQDMSAAEIRNHLKLLELERFEAESEGMLDDEDYKRDLEEEMAECRAAFVGVAVTEIALLRADLSGRQLG
jgi:hypothetical protein